MLFWSGDTGCKFTMSETCYHAKQRRYVWGDDVQKAKTQAER